MEKTPIPGHHHCDHTASSMADCANGAGNVLDAVAYRNIAKSHKAAEVETATKRSRAP
jgi:hypothetical protein